MKPTALFVFACLAFAEVFGASLFDEKEAAVEEINQKFKKLESTINEVKSKAKNEADKIDKTLIYNTKEEGERSKTENTKSIEEEVLKTAKTAIEKGKSLPVFDCILKANNEGKKQISETYDSFVKKVDDIVNQKLQGIKFAEAEVDLIQAATTDIKTKSIESIRSAQSGIQNLKSEALKKLDSAKKCLEEASIRIPKPYLSQEFETLKVQFKTKYEEIQKSSLNSLKKCVA